MNNIYNLIVENNTTYHDKNGTPDKKLNEIKNPSKLRKRREGETLNDKKYIFKFIDNMPRKIPKNNSKLKFKREKEEVEYIPFQSDLVKHICSISNEYVILAYLSDAVVELVRNLPNVTGVSKSEDLKLSYNTITNEYRSDFSTKYYNKEDIVGETRWKDMDVQEYRTDCDLKNTHLSLISQGKYYGNSTALYDNNYYYPSSAGKGIDIYVIDSGLDVSISEEDFDRYEGTPDERTIQCDGEFYKGEYHSPYNETYCGHKINFRNIRHGTFVSLSAVGKVNGAAKKANLHVLAIKINESDYLRAFEYIQNNATPHKSVINISIGCKENYDCFHEKVQNKLNELVEMGFIIFVSIGNSFDYECDTQLFRNGVIRVAATNNEYFSEFQNMENLYSKAEYSSYGECVDLFAPGTVRLMDKIDIKMSGTSFASPIAAGVSSTIMSENPHIKFNYESMKKKLIELSLKDVITGLDDDTPNRLLNNGKHSVYHSPRCDEPSGKYHCQDRCCSTYGVCVNSYSPEDGIYDLCYVSKGCQSEFGQCEFEKCEKKNNNHHCLPGFCCTNSNVCTKSVVNCLLEFGCQSEFGDCSTQRCDRDPNIYKCSEEECCTRNGQCQIIDLDSNGICLLENGCQSEFGKCSNLRCGKENNGKSCVEGDCCTHDGYCVKIKDNPNGLCLLENGCQSEFGECSTERCDIDPKLKRCSENQCCNKDGYCDDVMVRGFISSNVINEKCFIENGCQTKFSGQCLRNSDFEMNSHSRVYQDAYDDLKCEKLVQSYKENCSFSITDLSLEDEDDHARVCKSYREMKCKEFFESPTKFIESTCKISNNPIIDNIIERNLFCAKKNIDLGNDDFCINSILFFQYHLKFYPSIQDLVHQSCRYKECQEQFLEYVKYKNQLESEQNYYEFNNNIIDYLSSQECISLQKENENIPSTTVQQTTTTRKTTKTKPPIIPFPKKPIITKAPSSMVTKLQSTTTTITITNSSSNTSNTTEISEDEEEEEEEENNLPTSVNFIFTGTTSTSMTNTAEISEDEEDIFTISVNSIFTNHRVTSTFNIAVTNTAAEDMDNYGDVDDDDDSITTFVQNNIMDNTLSTILKKTTTTIKTTKPPKIPPTLKKSIISKSLSTITSTKSNIKIITKQ
ncbi:carbohydrate-binding module family 18 protein [Piromyces sp. E2]|nr:carbohydrate-binding module family 18 protein [Piromyces sp. E2]|eukprot:OUM61791.1 carbohydrate-binding module family 18 protein [Piromyces sp. E2]